jgi:hypothetical protein
MVRLFALATILFGAGICRLANDLRAAPAEIIDSTIGDRRVKMVLTGSAIRTKSIFKIYTIDSYVEQGVKIRTAQDMIAADQPKQLHLSMLRNVNGPDMAGAFVAMVRSNHPEPAFTEEVKAVAKILRGRTAHKGDEVWFTHIPKVGFQCKATGGVHHLIRNVEFSKAVWENYFGAHNVGEAVKQALLSRLPRE